MSQDFCNTSCPPGCDLVFDRVYVSMVVRGQTRVSWSLAPGFNDPQPHTYTLEVGTTGNPKACDWVQVGDPTENIFTQVDTEQRARGANNNVHYRVKLETPDGVYYSDPTGGWGRLKPRDWRIAREIVRKERLVARYSWQDGYLFKRRDTGVRCSCVDLQTGDVRDPSCEKCFGTGFLMGYYCPVPCVPANLSPETKNGNLDPQRGPINDIRVTARVIMDPLFEEFDVWVAANSDDRYIIREIQHVAEIQGVPLVATVGMRPATYDDPVYDLPIPNRND